MKKISSQHVDKKILSEDGSPFFREIQIEFLVHEMKDPVSIIETGARTLLEKKEKYGSLSDRQERTLKRILRNVKKTQTMLNDLLEIGRSEAGCFVCCSFSPGKVCLEALIDALETIAGGVSEHIPRIREEQETVAFLAGIVSPTMETAVSAALIAGILAPLIDSGVLALNSYQRGRRHG